MSDLGNKDVMASNLKRMLTYYEKTQKLVCKDLGIRETTFSDWVNAKSYPRIDKIELLAKYFGVKKSDLIERPASNKVSNAIRIPVLGSVPAGIPLAAIEEILDYEEIPESMASLGTYFGLKIKGHSMEPLINDEDIVIVRQESDIESGDIAIVMVNGDEATCKKVVKHVSGISLVPLNPAYDPMFFPNEEIESKPVRIIGKVVELRRKF